VAQERDAVEQMAAEIERLQAAAADAEADIRRLQAQKLAQSGGEVKALTDTVNDLSKQCAAMPLRPLLAVLMRAYHGRPP
jgi:phage host-nuclease inhibitor protein Gam